MAAVVPIDPVARSCWQSHRGCCERYVDPIWFPRNSSRARRTQSVHVASRLHRAIQSPRKRRRRKQRRPPRLKQVLFRQRKCLPPCCRCQQRRAKLLRQKTQQETAAVAPGSAPKLAWKLPDKIKAGEQFTALLHITSEEKLRGMPMLLAFDPQALQVVTVEEGDFLKQEAGELDFSSRVDPIQGRVFVAAVRQNTSGHDAGVSGAGTLLTVTFKAVRPADKVQVQLMSVSPEPQPATPVSLPVAATLKIVP